MVFLQIENFLFMKKHYFCIDYQSYIFKSHQGTR